ncbi:organ-specific protein S2-like [Durio zibethinus]|uniref:Organ-specific protein S2-like n=1 Tax=Durio zibethinus TaxID=66656 RepID=A0A6P6ABT5_DURZI|nr:organ-specific protein S2-like [Durio zibethinus]
MKSFLSSFAFLSLLLFADTIAAARKDAGEYWRAVMKDQPMPEAIEGLIRVDAVSSSSSSSSNEKTNCHTPTSFELREEKIIVEDFERARPQGDDRKRKPSFADDFEPRPNISAYGDDANLKGKKSSAFTVDFEPRPNVSSYGEDGDAGLKGEKKSFTSDFEPGPNILIYHD